MKGYKATYNGYCRGHKFEVGETYRKDVYPIACEDSISVKS